MHKFIEITNEGGESFLMSIEAIEAVIPDEKGGTKFIIGGRILQIKDSYASVKEKIDKATGGIC